MVKLLQFLNWEVTESQLDCVLRDSEGKFHRKRASRIDNLELLSIEQLRRVTDAYEELDSLVEKRITGGMLVSFWTYMIPVTMPYVLEVGRYYRGYIKLTWNVVFFY